MYSSFFKRLFDFSGALFLLLVLSPILIIFWICLTIANKRAGAFFVQARPGLKGKIFHIYKFKTMTDERDTEGNLLPDGVRLTKIGKIVRSLSIDELPQLLNVLKGDMSFIGPRPLLPSYLPYYTRRERTRHSVRPGITGLAQINGRNLLDWDRRLALDVIYAEKISISLDIEILCKTILYVLKRKDIVVNPSMKGTFLSKSRKIRLLQKSDLHSRVDWMNNPNTYNNMHYDTPVSIERTEKWYSNIINNTDRVDLVVENEKLSPVAMGGITNIDRLKSHGELYIFVNPSEYKKGYGSFATRLICEYGFNVENLNTIYLYTNTDNIASIRTYANVGFLQRTLSTESNRLYFEITPKQLKENYK